MTIEINSALLSNEVAVPHFSAISLFIPQQFPCLQWTFQQTSEQLLMQGLDRCPLFLDHNLENCNYHFINSPSLNVLTKCVSVRSSVNGE